MVVVIAGAGLFVYVRLRADLDETIDTGLRARSEAAVGLAQRPGEGLPGPAAGQPAEAEESFAEVIAPDGRVLEQVGGARGPVLSPAEAERAAREETVFEREVAGIEGEARVLARPVAIDGRRRAAVVGVSLLDRDETLSSLVASFAIGGPVAVLVASLLGYLLASAGLGPVEAMRRRAAGVSLSSPGERLPLPASNDEIRRLGETLNEMLARLEDSFERERRFVADASHEIRTPLAVLKAELEATLARGDGDEQTRESLSAAVEEADHLTQLAEDLLLVARAAEGKLPLRPEPLELKPLLAQTRERFVERARRQDREIVVDAPGELSWPLDPLRLRQALGNLVDNALRHGGGEIALGAREHEGELEIEVADEGAGFPADVAPRAFERFARDERTSTRGGAGLGLAIVRAIAEAHGGSVAIAVGDRRGAAVRLRFPRQS